MLSWLKRLIIICLALIVCYHLTAIDDYAQGSSNLAVILPYESSYEALHLADVSGANVGALIDQYNQLLDQSLNLNSSSTVSDTGFKNLGDQAVQAQETASVNHNVRNILILIIVPSIALVLGLLTASLISMVRRMQKNKFVHMRIVQS